MRSGQDRRRPPPTFSPPPGSYSQPLCPPRGAGHFHGRLVGLQGKQRVLRSRIPIALLDQDLDDRHVLEIADVGDLDLDGLVQPGRGTVARCPPPEDREASSLSFPRAGWRPALGLQQEDRVALRDAVAGLDLDLADRAGLRAGISRVALSDFSVIKGSSTATW